jgi:hypothetical protein
LVQPRLIKSAPSRNRSGSGGGRLWAERRALEAAGLNVLFVTNSVVLDNYWSAPLKRLVNGQPGKRGDWRYLGDLREWLAVLAGLRRRRDELGRAQAAE